MEPELVLPDHFPAFVAAQISDPEEAANVKYMLEKPWKWEREWREFLEGMEAAR